MHERSPKRGEFQSEKEYHLAYYQWLCIRYPDLDSSTIGAVLKRRLLNGKNLDDESACANKNKAS